MSRRPKLNGYDLWAYHSEAERNAMATALLDELGRVVGAANWPQKFALEIRPAILRLGKVPHDPR